MTASEAYAAGLVTSVVPAELYLEEAIRLARVIAAKSPNAVRLAKESVLKSFESSLDTGLDYERRSFNLLFASEDAREGMRAFLEKREPSFTGQ
jgi:enoyl-CoA hydratase